MKTCQQCRKVLKSYQEKFCSRKCKADSQRKRIKVKCFGCNKEFSIWPYLKRKTNYCLVECYRNSTKEGETRKCLECGKIFYAKGFLVKKGFGFFCNQKCQKLNTIKKRVMIKCMQCQGGFYVPQSIAKKHPSFCSKKCHDDCMRDYIKKTCKNCHKQFQLPRWELNKGKGSFCCRDCFIQYKGETTIEKKVRQTLGKSGLKFKQEFKIDIYRADFLILDKKVIIECDGDYWHKIPGATNRDLRKDKYLHNKGFIVLRIAESTIRKLSLPQLIKHILGKINQ